MTHEFCKSHYLSQFATFFIDVGAKTSPATGCISVNQNDQMSYIKVWYASILHLRNNIVYAQPQQSPREQTKSSTTPDRNQQSIAQPKLSPREQTKSSTTPDRNQQSIAQPKLSPREHKLRVQLQDLQSIRMSRVVFVIALHSSLLFNTTKVPKRHVEYASHLSCESASEFV